MLCEDSRAHERHTQRAEQGAEGEGHGWRWGGRGGQGSEVEEHGWSWESGAISARPDNST